MRAHAVQQHRLSFLAQVADGARGVDQLTGEVVVGVLLVDDPELDVVLGRDAGKRREPAGERLTDVVLAGGRAALRQPSR